MHSEKIIPDKKVSIIIPCYNQGKFVGDAIASALNQSYKNIEIVCVNDGSKDNSTEIIRNFADKYKNIVFFDLKENKGVINARNFAIEASLGDYILPLDADDIIESTYVEKAVEILDKNSEIGIVYCKAGKFGKKNEFWNLAKFNLDDFLYENCIFNCALFRKKDFVKAGKYKENLNNGHEDWDLWLSIIELGLQPYCINEILFNYRQHENLRTKVSFEDSSWKFNIFQNHKNLYINNKKFILNAFENNSWIKKELKKYKKLFYYSIILWTILFILLLWSI